MVDASEKYGDGQQMLVAVEPIAAGEKIWWSSSSDDDDYILSRDEILHLIEIQPHLRSFLCWYSYMVILSPYYLFAFIVFVISDRR